MMDESNDRERERERGRVREREMSIVDKIKSIKVSETSAKSN